MAQNIDVSYEQMRSLVLEVLRRKSADQLAGLREAVATIAHERGLLANEQRHSTIFGQGGGISGSDYARVQSIIWDLIIEGVVRPGLNEGMNNSLPFFHVTEWGKRAIEGGDANPYDPDGYLAKLKADVPTIDPIIETYLNESLHTFRIGCLLSSTISLGCASEKALLLLIGVYRDSLPSGSQAKFRSATEGRMIKVQFDELRKRIESELKSRLPYDLRDGLDIELTALFDFIRNQRNDAGHPTGVKIERERAYANLIVVSTYLRKVYSIIEWLHANPLT